MRSSQPKYVRNKCKAVIRRRSSPVGTTHECQSQRCGRVRAAAQMLVGMPSALQAASTRETARLGVCSSNRLVPGRMLNIPTLNCGRAHATRKYRARVPPSRVSFLTERQPTWGRGDWRQSGSHALWWGCYGAIAGGALSWMWRSSCRPGGRPKRTASVTLGEWGRRRGEGGIRPP